MFIKMNLSYIKKRMKAHLSIFYMLVKMICMKKWEKKGVYNDKELLFKDYQILRQKILDRPYIRCYIDVYEVNKGFKKFYEASQFFKLFLNKSESIWK